jgi:hypothetical protein
VFVPISEPLTCSLKHHNYKGLVCENKQSMEAHGYTLVCSECIVGRTSSILFVGMLGWGHERLEGGVDTHPSD